MRQSAGQSVSHAASQPAGQPSTLKHGGVFFFPPESASEADLEGFKGESTGNTGHVRTYNN